VSPTGSVRMRRGVLRHVGVALMALVAALALPACGDSGGAPLKGVVRAPLPEVGALTLPDVAAGGAEVPFRADDGGILVVYFGFTSCPDVCPTTMADLREALRSLGEDAERVSVALVTVDPGRDSDEVLTDYVEYFAPGGHALRTDDDARLRDVAAGFGASYTVATVDGAIEVAHTGHLYAVDEAGRLLVTWLFGTSPEDLRADLVRLLEDGAAATGAV
jgi:protein SCO1